MSRPGFFTALAATVLVLAIVRWVSGGPLLPSRARQLSRPDLAVAGASFVLLAFHCASMFAAGWIAAIGILDAPAAVTRDLGDPVGQVAYWLPAVTFVLAVRRTWWPAPVGLSLALFAVGWTMYGGTFSTDEHLATIATAVIGIAVTMAALVSGSSSRPASSRFVGRVKTTVSGRCGAR